MCLYLFFNAAGATEIYTRSIVGSVRVVYETDVNPSLERISSEAGAKACPGPSLTRNVVVFG